MSLRDKAEVHLASLLANATRYIQHKAKNGVSTQISIDNTFDADSAACPGSRMASEQGKKSNHSSRSSNKECETCGHKLSSDTMNRPTENPEWSKILIQIEETERQWNAARLETRKVAFESQYLHPHVSASFFAKKDSRDMGAAKLESNDMSPPSRTRSCEKMFTHKIFGIAPPLDNDRGSRDSHYGDPGDTEQYLDLARVHQLQRDLCKFSEKVFLICGGSIDTLNSSQQPIIKVTTMNELLDIAGQLMLHVSSMATVAPLRNIAPFRSSMTGLEELIDIVSTYLNIFHSIGPYISLV